MKACDVGEKTIRDRMSKNNNGHNVDWGHGYG